LRDLFCRLSAKGQAKEIFADKALVEAIDYNTQCKEY
jgi:hypothetical protein